MRAQSGESNRGCCSAYGKKLTAYLGPPLTERIIRFRRSDSRSGAPETHPSVQDHPKLTTMSIDLRFTDTEPLAGGGLDFGPASSRFRAFHTRPHPPLHKVATRGPFYDVAPDIVGLKTGISNVFFIGEPGSRNWFLVDAGMPGSAGKIIDAAERRFGSRVPPRAILLTHGHFDHVGALATLLKEWDVPVYAHLLELPYLTGQSSYPPPDPSVGGGGMAWMSVFYPKKPIDLGSVVHPLPPDGQLPQFPGWQWLPTPGHTAGHVSFYRESDRILIVGDAFVTIRAESVVANLTLAPEVHGPPAYFTPDWPAACASVEMLADLDPEVVATGHGVPLRGGNMRAELRQLAERFEVEAIPAHGRYIAQPAVADGNGVLSLPPRLTRRSTTIALMLGTLVGGVLLGLLAGRIFPSRDPYSWRNLTRR